MARITVEDCVIKVPNLFDLVIIASQRARDLSGGARLTVERDNDKYPVIALREIADDTLELHSITNNIINNMRRNVFVEECQTNDDIDGSPETDYEQSQAN